MVMARTDALAIEGLSSAINRMEKYVEAVRLAAGSPCGTPAQRVQSLNRHAPGGRLRASRLHGAAASARTDGGMCLQGADAVFPEAFTELSQYATLSKALPGVPILANVRPTLASSVPFMCRRPLQHRRCAAGSHAASACLWRPSSEDLCILAADDGIRQDAAVYCEGAS